MADTTEEEDKLEMLQYRYFPKNLEMTLDENYEFRDGSVLYLNIIHDYVSRKMPVIQIGLEMDHELIKKLYEYRDTAILKLEIYEQEYRHGEIIETRLYLQHTFSIVPAREQNVYITTDDETTKKLQDKMKTAFQNVEMYLVDMDAVNWFSQEISINYKKTTIAKALHELLLERDIPPKITVATPPLIEDELDTITIPLQDLVHNIYHMNNTYGMYDCKPIIYYDLTYLYCLSKTKPDIVIPDLTEYGNVGFILLDPVDPAHMITGSCDDEKTETHWINLKNAPEIYDESTMDTSSKFSTLTMVDSSGKVNKTTRDDKVTAQQYNYANNELTEKQILNETIFGHTLSLRAMNSSVRFLKPYKDYMFAVGESYMNLGLAGNTYRLLSWTLGIRREGMDTYVNDVSMVLYNPKRENSNKEQTPAASISTP